MMLETEKTQKKYRLKIHIRWGQYGPSLEMVLEVVLLAALHRCASEFEVFSQVAVVTIIYGVLDSVS